MILTDNFLVKHLRTQTTYKKVLWAYILLLFLEASLRKWFLPFLSTPLLLVRDPFAIFLVLYGFRYKIIPFSRNLFLVYLFTVVSFILTMVAGHKNLFVALFGFRIMIFHFPMIFIIGNMFKKEDVLVFCKFILYLSIPAFMLVFFQFKSPQTAWVNRAVGGVNGVGFTGFKGYFRPSGLFSFTSGNVQFWSCVGAILLYSFVNENLIDKRIRIICTGVFLMAIPMAISRTLVVQTLISLGFFGAILLRNRILTYKVFKVVVTTLVVSLVLINLNFVGTSIDVISGRFDDASRIEGGNTGYIIINRFLGSMLNSVLNSNLIGQGLGLGTNVGSKLSTGTVQYLIAEGEWGRVIGERGILLALPILLIRLQVVVKSFYLAKKKLSKSVVLPWLLFSVSSLLLILGQWGQPASLGFAVITGGLLLASVSNKL